jgi:23S rRNA (pseudouridine1915-N3)-methyltransferase
MKIVLLAVGKSNNSNLAALQSEYESRLTHYVPYQFVVVPELKNTKNLSIQEQKEKEADALLKVLETSDDVILLDEKGHEYSSMEFADFISKKMLNSNKRMVFVVGGPFGFSDRIYARANGKISLSAMTFSHQMIRVLFVEQLYRSYTIIKGESYHHQ